MISRDDNDITKYNTTKCGYCWQHLGGYFEGAHGS
jgi:hypothetical protein